VANKAVKPQREKQKEMHHDDTYSRSMKGVTIRKRGGRYQVRWRQDGRERGATFRTEAEATSLRGSLLAGTRRGRRDVGRMTAYQLFEQWFDTRIHCAPQTKKRDIAFVNNYVFPFFGDKAIDEIEPWDARNWKEFLLAGCKGEQIGGSDFRALAPATVYKALQLFSQALDYAVQEGYVRQNVVSGTDVKDHTKALVKAAGFREAPSHEVAALVIEALAQLGPMHEALGRLLCDSGLRIGEALALDARHLILTPDRYAVVVEQSWNLTENLRHLHVGEVKTFASARVVPTLRPSTAALLATLASGKKPWDPVFAGERGARIHPTNYRNRTFNLAVRPIDTSLTPHSLRHYAISSWLEAGMDEWTAAKYAGHKSIQMIRTRYGHAIQKTKVAEARLCTALEQHRLDIERQLLPLVAVPAARAAGDHLAAVTPLRPIPAA
jgi:integrase